MDARRRPGGERVDGRVMLGLSARTLRGEIIAVVDMRARPVLRLAEGGALREKDLPALGLCQPALCRAVPVEDAAALPPGESDAPHAPPYRTAGRLFLSGVRIGYFAAGYSGSPPSRSLKL